MINDIYHKMFKMKFNEIESNIQEHMRHVNKLFYLNKVPQSALEKIDVIDTEHEQWGFGIGD